MTNAIIMTAMLSTNWSGFVQLTGKGSNGWDSVKSAEVYRYVVFHTMDGTNRINWGHTMLLRAGTISKTNDVLGPIVWTPPYVGE